MLPGGDGNCISLVRIWLQDTRAVQRNHIMTGEDGLSDDVPLEAIEWSRYKMYTITIHSIPDKSGKRR